MIELDLLPVAHIVVLLLPIKLSESLVLLHKSSCQLQAFLFFQGGHRHRQPQSFFPLQRAKKMFGVLLFSLLRMITREFLKVCPLLVVQ